LNPTVAVFALIFLFSFVSPMEQGSLSSEPDVITFDQQLPSAPIAPAFSPDGSLVIFGQSEGEKFSLYISHRLGKTWSKAELAPFSGTFRDMEATFAPNGRYVVFASNRPLHPGGTSADGFWLKQHHPQEGAHLWKVERIGKGWGTPEPLPAIINANDSVFSPSITGDGSLYFMRSDAGGHDFHLFRSQMRSGQYLEPQPLPFSQTVDVGDYDPAVSADDSFMIFSSSRSRDAKHHTGLFLVYRTANGWSQPLDLFDRISPQIYGAEARLADHDHSLYFTRSLPGASSQPPVLRTSHISLPKGLTKPVSHE
jgi:WD40-like Beta Propeller Repeat